MKTDKDISIKKRKTNSFFLSISTTRPPHRAVPKFKVVSVQLITAYRL